MKSTPFIRRAASPVEAEPLTVAVEDILCPASDTEDSLERRKSKRRRIEAQAQRYLEGKPLFIQSALLRGPLDTGWINPWKKKPRKRGGIFRIPDQTDVVDLTEANPPPVLPPVVTRQENVSNMDLHLGTDVASHGDAYATSPLVPIAQTANGNEVGGESRIGGGNHTMASRSRTKDWSKSDVGYLNGGRERDPNSPTPTPMTRQRLRPETYIGYRETFLHEADEATKLGFFGAKALARAAVRDLQDEEGHNEARRLSQQAALVASRSAIAPEAQALEALEPNSVSVFKPPPMKETVATGKSNSVSATLQSKDSPHAIPPSSNLAGFQYRIARKKAPIDNTANLSPCALELEVAKAKAVAKKTKHLSFTSSGSVKNFESRSPSRNSSVEAARSRLNHRDPICSQEDGHRKSNLAQSVLSSSTDQEVTNAPSNVMLEGPEAQPAAAPSYPSTDFLETDKQSLKIFSEEGEGDSYMGLSTQAALSKAQQSFQDAISPPAQDAPERRMDVDGSQPSPTAYKTPIGNLSGVLRTSRLGNADGDQFLTPEVLNTQAMIDAISPFAPSTAKKTGPETPMQLQKQTSFVHPSLPSPSQTFGTTRRSLSMSTSSESASPTPSRKSTRRTPRIEPPSILSKTSTGVSKPLSTATSIAFSIAPNGTVTETYQQDGQQQNQVGMGVDSSWDLDQAIEEAGSFLETLDVDAVARKGVSCLASGNKN